MPRGHPPRRPRGRIPAEPVKVGDTYTELLAAINAGKPRRVAAGSRCHRVEGNIDSLCPGTWTFIRAEGSVSTQLIIEDGGKPSDDRVARASFVPEEKPHKPGGRGVRAAVPDALRFREKRTGKCSGPSARAHSRIVASSFAERDREPRRPVLDARRPPRAEVTFRAASV
jgi:hypothetical protein